MIINSCVPQVQVVYITVISAAFSPRVLDDDELFVQEQHFTVVDLIEMSAFLNMLVFKMIWELQFPAQVQDLLVPCHSLLTLLYSRDSRRQFCDIDHWLIRYVRACWFNFMQVYMC